MTAVVEGDAVTDASWNFMDPGSKERLLGVLRREMNDTFALVADPARWEAATACELWQTRDVIGHLVDTTEGYLPAFELAHQGGTGADALGLKIMAQRVDEQARALRKVGRDELIERLRDDADRMLAEFESLSDEQWTTLMVAHTYMGPLPAMFYPVFQLVDYAVHSWDIREGTGQPHGLAGDSADLLVPVIFILWGATADTSQVAEPFRVGLRVGGHNGGDTRAEVSSEGVRFAPGDIDDCDAIIEFDPASLVLTGYDRMNTGTVRGDPDVASRFRSLFFAI